MRVLILEDDKPTAEALRNGFLDAGFTPEVITKGSEALAAATEKEFDLLVFDVMVPDRDGFSVVQELRKQKKNIPVIFLSAKRSLEERLEGLNIGADDYITKPFSISELIARSRAILRRTSQKQPESHVVHYQGLELDLLARTVKRGDKTIELQQKEFILLEFLIRNQGHVITKTQILEKVWNYNFDPQTNVVDVLVCRLRNKLERNQSEKLIKTIRGIGYVLKAV